MSTRLECLVKTLKTLEYDVKLINDLILVYYSNSDAKDFQIEGLHFGVLTEDEMFDLLYEVAETLYYDYFEKLAECSYDIPHIDCLLKVIHEDRATNNIANELDYLQEFNCEKLDYVGNYTIFQYE